MDAITIKTPYIKLDQALKFSGTVSDGSDARFLITEGFVKVNGETEIRRGRKLYKNDVVKVEYEGQKSEFYISE